MRRLSLAMLLMTACQPQPLPLVVEPDATLPPPHVIADPPPGPFNGTQVVSFKADRVGATVYVSTEGRDPRTSSVGRLQGDSVQVTLTQTTTLQFFAAIDGEADGDLAQGEWVRAGGPVGTISGLLVVGEFAINKQLGLTHNGATRELAAVNEPTEIPFRFEGLNTGAHRLRGIMDRDGDGNLFPFLDYEGEQVTVDLDLNDPYKAGPENVKVYLGASQSGLGAIGGIITLPKPPPFQQLRISALSGDLLGAASNPTALLQQLQSGYQVFTNATDTEYPYLITDLMPGRYTPVPALIGFGNGGIAFNLIANPLQPKTVVADRTTRADFAYGPVGLSGNVTVSRANPNAAGAIPFGVVAGRAISLSDGVQAVLMPVLFTRDSMTGDLKASYGGQAFKGNTTISLRAFVGVQGLTEALTWVLNPLSGTPADATVVVTDVDATQDLLVP